MIPSDSLKVEFSPSTVVVNGDKSYSVFQMNSYAARIAFEETVDGDTFTPKSIVVVLPPGAAMQPAETYRDAMLFIAGRAYQQSTDLVILGKDGFNAEYVRANV